MIAARGSYADAINLAALQASLINGNTRYAQTFDSPPATAVFTLYGVVTYNGLDVEDDSSTRRHGRQICLAPFDLGFGRVLAVLRHLCGEGYFFMNSFRKGLSIATGQFNCSYHLLDT